MLFSVIIPTYNRAGTITDTINSVLGQTYRNFELLIIDDGSTDDTREVIANITAQDPRLRYIYQENQERCVARNNGIDQAKGEWICFLDSDDFFKPHHLETLQGLITLHPDQYAFATSIEGAGISNPKNNFTLSFKQFLKSNNLNLAQLCYSKLRFPELRFPLSGIIMGEDLYFIRSLTLQTTILQTPEKTVFKKEDIGRKDARINKPFFIAEEFYKNSKFFVDQHRDSLSFQDANTIMSFASLVAANILMGTGNKKAGLSYLRSALKYPPTYSMLSLYNCIFKFLFKN